MQQILAPVEPHVCNVTVDHAQIPRACMPSNLCTYAYLCAWTSVSVLCTARTNSVETRLGVGLHGFSGAVPLVLQDFICFLYLFDPVLALSSIVTAAQLCVHPLCRSWGRALCSRPVSANRLSLLSLKGGPACGQWSSQGCVGALGPKRTPKKEAQVQTSRI